MKNQYPHLFKLLFVYNILFGSTYLCERPFSDMLTLKNTKRNILDFEKDLRCVLSKRSPCKMLIKKL